MKQAIFLLCGVYLTILGFKTVAGSYEFHSVVNPKTGLTEFTIVNNTIYLANQHRAPEHPSLKISVIGGVQIEQVRQFSPTQWALEIKQYLTPQDWSVHETRYLEIEHQEVEGKNVSEYHLTWHGAGPRDSQFLRKLCFHHKYNGASWYGAYQTPQQDSNWPFTGYVRPERRSIFPYGSPLSNLSIDSYHFMKLGQPLWINTDGFAVMITDTKQKLFWNIEDNQDAFCFCAENAEPYQDVHSSVPQGDLDIKFVILTGSNIRTVYQGVAKNLPHVSLSIPNEAQFATSIWHSFSTQAVEFADKLVQHGLTGEFVLDHYPIYKETIVELHKRNIRAGIAITPNMFALDEEHKHFLVNGTKDNLLDFSREEVRKWFEGQLDYYHKHEGWDAFHVHTTYTDWRLFLETVTSVGVPTYAKMGMFSQMYPGFVELHPWEGYKYGDTIPTALSVSLGGYSYVVGQALGTLQSMEQPSKSMYMNKVKQATLLPGGLSFAIPPWEYDEETVNATRRMQALHAQFVPTFMELARKRVEDGSPIMRPMWWAAPDDERTYKLSQQFMLGDDWVVAPWSDQNDIYLPSGQWTDQRGRTHTGPGFIGQMKVTLDELAYFQRKH